jgi:hypothetical protein
MRRNRDAELSGTKQHVKLRCQIVKEINPSSYANIPQAAWKKWDTSKKFLHVVKVNFSDIDTYEKLAWVCRKHFGYGTLNILFYNRLQKNKKFKRNFTCLIQRDMECPKKQQCRIYSRHKKGYACKMNPKIWPNWAKRAQVTIDPVVDFMSTKDYSFKFNKRCDKMFYFKKLGWKGREGRR